MNTDRIHSIALAASAAVSLNLVATAATGMPIQTHAAAQAHTAAPACAAPGELIGLARDLPRIAMRIAQGRTLKIVAFGSSSTSGAGASSPAHTYPSRLEAELRARFPRIEIVVVNQGVGGEDAKEMLARVDKVIEESPDLVLWQVGTNAVVDDVKLAEEGSLIRAGLVRLKATGADVVLIDPQFAPKVITKANAARVVDLLGMTAEHDRISVFRRYAIMRHWHNVEHISFKRFIAPDGLHMNDWSYDCIAKLLANAIVDAASRPMPTALAPVRSGNAGS